MPALHTSPAQITAALGGQWHAARSGAEPQIIGIAPIETAGPSDICFLAHAKYAKHLEITQAACVILPAALQAHAQSARADLACIVTDDPYLYYARLSQWWAKHTRGERQPGIHASAVVDPSAKIDPTACIGALCYIGPGASVGAHSELRARVTLEADCHVGERCLIHSGVVIGADGFGFAPTRDKQWHKIAQLGGVRIGNDVEIGANTCIDRGALADTVLEDGVKLDNLVQIGHNVHVGAHTAMAGCAGVAGSATIGKHCTVGGGAVVLGHLSLADGVHVSASSTVMRGIHEPGVYSGVFPLDANADWEKSAVLVRRLPDLRERVKQLEAKVNTIHADQLTPHPNTEP